MDTQNLPEQQRSHPGHGLYTLVAHKVKQQVVDAAKTVNRVPFTVLRPQEVAKHEFVSGVLERRQTLGVVGVQSWVKGHRMRREEVLGLQSGTETGQVQEGVENLRNS